jgi:hypothetical protein
MSPANPFASSKGPALTNGSAAAAMLSAGIGSFTLALLSLAADKVASIKSLLNFYKPTGPLSGVTTVAIVVWLLTWVLLEVVWTEKTVAAARIIVIAFVLLGLSFLLTFPPIGDLF